MPLYKKSNYQQTWTDPCEKEWDVDYSFEGQYYPGDHENPPEYPSVVINSVTDSEGNEFAAPYPDDLYFYLDVHHEEPEDDDSDYERDR